MNHNTLTLEIPEELYQPLRQAAEASDQTIEALILQWLAQRIPPPAPTDDPIESLIGSIHSDLPA